MQPERAKQLLMIVGIIVISTMFLPVLIDWATNLLTHGINEAGSLIQQVFNGAFSTRGTARIEGLVRLALWLAAILALAKLIFRRRG